MKTFLLCSLLFAFSCTKKNAVSFETAETSRKTARENAKLNALEWRANNPEFKEWSIYTRGDSTIARDCPQGDGWASIDVKKEDKIVKLMCSTISNAIGCMVSSDFKTKRYAKEDGACNKNVPFPLPKLAQ